MTGSSACSKVDNPDRELRDVTTGWILCLMKVYTLSEPWRCRAAVEGADSTATHSHQHTMPKHVCGKKHSRTA